MLSHPTDQPPQEAPIPLGRRARKALAVRRSLFAAGLAAFEREPIGLVSVLDITEAADVAKGVFYLHFSSKDEYLLALWEDVQRSFLESARAASADCGSLTARIEATVRRFTVFVRGSPSATRFWIRMSSCFRDEVGEPGHLTRIHDEYVQQLAAILAGRDAEELAPDDLVMALLVHSVCWGVTQTSLSAEQPICDDETLLRIVNSAVKLADSRGLA